ncbi:2Fe-2S iron-sulfur cluster-binding protein [Paenalcaligenes hominis]|uniref:2Fe-2S ferredoxin-type domain-containing protein n=1 Tax=Paenalcaligenes hominis TaxID=643674 RepID=A0A1U9K0E3_9BURK|nr:2Fe-2S iron-sulfur cluster-binding protein [Paenalcaligenes hominis]AQS51454.1 hypothetical protein PAEH1_07610 [Paenalcaligenes hominis]
MITVTYIEFDGTAHQIQTEPGTTLMKAAVYNGVPGIDAECGGACACATCHVYIDANWQSHLPGSMQEERDMLDFAQSPQDNSRLSCQVILTEAMDGLTVRLPECQS